MSQLARVKGQSLPSHMCLSLVSLGCCPTGQCLTCWELWLGSTITLTASPHKKKWPWPVKACFAVLAEPPRGLKKRKKQGGRSCIFTNHDGIDKKCSRCLEIYWWLVPIGWPMTIVMSWWPFLFFVGRGAMNRTCSVPLKIRTCWKFMPNATMPWDLSSGVWGEGFDSTSAPRLRCWFWLLWTLRAVVLMRLYDDFRILCSLGCITGYGLLTYRCGSSIAQQDVWWCDSFCCLGKNNSFRRLRLLRG